jgi:hypothetical protein
MNQFPEVDAEEIAPGAWVCLEPAQSVDIAHVVKLLKLVKRFNGLGHIQQANELLDTLLEYMGAPGKDNA